MASIAETFIAFAVRRMQLSAKDIDACVAQLTEEQMGRRGGDHENSIANLLLHLEGNIRQWILHGIANQPDVRRRDDEFALAPSTSGAEAHAAFTATLAEACQAISSLAPEQLLYVIDPQPNGTWRNVTILEAIFQISGHLQLHAGQIILLTKQYTARDLDLTMPRKR